MNSASERTPKPPNETAASVNEEDREEVGVADEENENETSMPSEPEAGTEDDVRTTIVRQTMHRLWETNDFLEQSYQMDLEVKHIMMLYAVSFY